MNELLRKIKLLSEKEPKNIEQMALKLSEEAGETSQAVLSYINASGSGYKNLGVDDVKEECIDVILVALSMYYKLENDPDELHDLIRKKLSKWESKIN